MATISPAQLDTIANFLAKSREYLDIEHPIHLHWPHAKNACGSSRAGARGPARPARAGTLRPGTQAGRSGA